MNLSRYLVELYFPLNPGMSERTRKLYDLSVRKFELTLGRFAELSDLTNLNIARHMTRLKDSGLAIASVNKEFNQLMAMARAARDDGLIDKIPRIKALPEPERMPTALTVEQCVALRKATCTRTGSYDGIPARLLFRAMISVMYATGERIGAVLQLQWADVSDGFVVFRAETRKGGRSCNVKQLPDWAMADLEAIRRPGRDDVFPFGADASTVFYHFSQIFKAAEVARPKGRSSHLLRSTHATQVVIAGGNASEALGHARPETTAKHYIDRRHLPNRDVRLPRLG